jgi:ferredoxin-nitrate reductase
MGKNTFQCPYCGVGCGLITNLGEEKYKDLFKDEVIPSQIKVRGNPDHPANRGLVCLKGVTLPQTFDKNRLTTPLYRESINEPFKEISWKEAYQILVEKLKKLSPEEIYFYISGQLTTEDSYVINKFAKGFLKTNNIDANSRLCMASAVVAYKMAFGSDGPPCCYEDLEDADVFLFIGSNAAEAHPVLFNRIQRTRKPDTVVVTVDPYYNDTAKKSDVHIKINAGTDTVLLNSVLYLLHQWGRIDKNFIERYTENFDQALEEAKKYPPEVAAKICGIPKRDIELLAYLFANAKKLISFWAMGLNQSVNAVMKNLALINLHLATGRLGDRGCPFSLTGQPNAMGGREVGYLTNGLPGYRDVRNEEERKEVEHFWGLEGIKPTPGPVITEAIDLILEGKIKLLWVVATNPAITLPNLKKVWKALEKVFLVVNEAYADSDTLKFANLVFPAQIVPEKEGIMTATDRTLTYIHQNAQPPKNTKPDWLIFTEVANLMGGEKYFPYKDRKDIFEEYKKLTKGRLCDISTFEEKDLPKRWGAKHLYKTPEGGFKFKTPGGKAKFHPTPFEIAEIDKEQLKEKGLEGILDKDEFILINGRIKNQWHTMTKTGKVDSLLKQELPPFVIIHPKDAFELGIEEMDIVKISDGENEIYRVALLRNIKRKHIFTYFGYPLWYTDTPTNLVVADRVDPYSKEPDLKFRRVRVSLHKKADLAEL